MSKKRMTPLTALRDIHDLLYLKEPFKVLYYSPDKARLWNRDMIHDIADIVDKVIPRPTRACQVDTYPWRKSPGRKKTHKR